MKREINCNQCASHLSKVITGSRFVDGQIMDPFPGEHAKFLAGKVIKHCMCDSCGRELEPRDPAVAVSIWADYGGVGYYEWEAEYLL